jgi:hypothetical protein
VLLLALGLIAAHPVEGVAQAGAPLEYQLKAAFLFNFGQFVSWLPEHFGGPNEPFVIGVLGDDPFGPTLDAVVGGARINERETVVRRYATVDEIENCQILFVSRSETPQLDAILARVAGRGILTVGEGEDFARRAGMIRLMVVDNRLRLEINPDAATASGLEVSSKLLQLADIVSTGDRQEAR